MSVEVTRDEAWADELLRQHWDALGDGIHAFLRQERAARSAIAAAHEAGRIEGLREGCVLATRAAEQARDAALQGPAADYSTMEKRAMVAERIAAAIASRIPTHDGQEGVAE